MVFTTTDDLKMLRQRSAMLAMSDGVLGVTRPDPAGMFTLVDFKLDRAVHYFAGVADPRRWGGVANRNADNAYVSDAAFADIVSRLVVSVDAKVFSGEVAPTFIVGTAGGVSLMRAADTVYDLSIASGAVVRLSSDDEIVVLSTGVAHIWDDPGSIAADGVAPDSTITFALGTPTVLEVA
jgi:hypothetical protein